MTSSTVVLTAWEKRLCNAAAQEACRTAPHPTSDMQKAFQAALNAKKNALYHRWLAQEVLKHAVFYDKDLEQKVRAQLCEIISQTTAVTEDPVR
jgi:hypothetical protein